MTAKDVSHAVRTERELKGMSQATLAKRVGLQQAALSRIETGRQSLSIEHFLAIARALRVPPMWFLMDVDPHIRAKRRERERARVQRLRKREKERVHEQRNSRNKRADWIS